MSPVFSGRIKAGSWSRENSGPFNGLGNYQDGRSQRALHSSTVCKSIASNRLGHPSGAIQGWRCTSEPSRWHQAHPVPLRSQQRLGRGDAPAIYEGSSTLCHNPPDWTHGPIRGDATAAQSHLGATRGTECSWNEAGPSMKGLGEPIGMTRWIWMKMEMGCMAIGTSQWSDSGVTLQQLRAI